MSDVFSQFLASAKSITLSEAEKAYVRQTLEMSMQSEGSVLRSARSTVLTPQEKDGGRLVLQKFMQEHPVERSKQWSFLGVFRPLRWFETPRTLTRHGEPCRIHTCQGAGLLTMTQRAEFLGRFLSLRFASGVMAAIVIFFSVGGAAAYAAESALPGNPLYPLKIYITEPLREHLSITPRARAAWRAERIVRRLREAEEMLTRSSEREQEIPSFQERVERHMEKMEERLKDVESEEDKEELRLRLEGAIRHHEDVLLNVEQHRVPRERSVEFHNRMKQKKQFLRSVFREHVRKPVKDVFEVTGEVEVDEYGDETGESEETEESKEAEEKAGERSDIFPVELPEKSKKEKRVPLMPVVLPQPLRKIHTEKESIHREDAESEDEPMKKKEKAEEREKENTPSFFQDLQREILPSLPFEHFRIEE